MFPTDSLSGKEILRKRERFARRAYQLDPQDPDALRAMMQVYSGKWQWTKFDEIASEAIRLHPNNAEVIAFASLKYVLRDQPEKYLMEAERAVKNDPLNYLYHAMVGEAHMRKGDLLKAEASMKTALSLGRDVPGMWGAMADISVAKRDFIAAEAYLDSASEEIFYFKLLRYYMNLKAGRAAEANSMLNSIKATEAENNPAVVGICYAYQGSYDSAFHYLYAARRDSSEAVTFLLFDYWLPANFKKDNRFSELMKSVGLKDR
jgi:Tfp pilus assembly protein PilF